MKKIILLLIAINLNICAQTKHDNITIEIKKSKIVDNVSVFGVRQLKVTSDDLQKVMIKAKITSDNNTINRTKLSAFSLVDNVNKIRYRLADYKGYTAFVGYPELIPFRKSELYDKKGKVVNYSALPPYSNSEKDYFNDYDIDGYSNAEIKINFGSESNPMTSIIYFGQTEYSNFTAELYFAIKKSNKNLSYELYYKNEKISVINFK
jgi:hypothetical protein